MNNLQDKVALAREFPTPTNARDKEPFVRRLYEDLSKAGCDVWFDRVFMPSRKLTYRQAERLRLR